MSAAETGLVLSVFAACFVEAVEALTVVLALGYAREWRSPLLGAAVACVLLAALTGALGPALTSLPLDTLRLIVGGLLLIFGLGWLRKAILRAAGVKALHDEDAAFRAEREAATSAPGSRSAVDPYSFTLSFKSTLLEGLEVVVIVLTFGANQGRVGLAALAAAAAVAVVVCAGVALRRPLAGVPENALKFSVGVMLTSFGIFWGAEGAGADWPGGDAALLAVIPTVLLASLAMARTVARHEAVAP
jgi:uncharacterized membrane protein